MQELVEKDEERMHFGEALIGELKKDRRYGSFFSYEEYQALHHAASLAELEALLQRTRFAECLLCDDVSVIYSDLLLLDKQQDLMETLTNPSDSTVVGEEWWVLLLGWLWKGLSRRSMTRQLEQVVLERATLRLRHES